MVKKIYIYVYLDKSQCYDNITKNFKKSMYIINVLFLCMILLLIYYYECLIFIIDLFFLIGRLKLSLFDLMFLIVILSNSTFITMKLMCIVFILCFTVVKY